MGHLGSGHQYTAMMEHVRCMVAIDTGSKLVISKIFHLCSVASLYIVRNDKILVTSCMFFMENIQFPFPGMQKEISDSSLKEQSLVLHSLILDTL